MKLLKLPSVVEVRAIYRQEEVAIVQFVISLIIYLESGSHQCMPESSSLGYFRQAVHSGYSSNSVSFTFLSGYDKIMNAWEKITCPNLGPKIPQSTMCEKALPNTVCARLASEIYAG